MMSERSETKDDDGGTGEESVGDLVETSSLSSYSSMPMVESIEDALETFREQWQRELEASAKSRDENPTNIFNSDLNKGESSIEFRAKNLFLKGVEFEKSGELYDAIRFYKRAVQLVPDIELRLYESSKSKISDKLENNDGLKTLSSGAQNVYENVGNDDDDDDDDDNDENDFLEQLTKNSGHNHCVCFPQHEQNAVHFSALPMEIVLYILRWVVSSELDLRSLEIFSRVCRGFFICARDPEIWRIACVRVWGVNCGNYEPKYLSWREMYINRPRLRYNGCYISKTTYMRHGENSYQDAFYRPWHFVEYYRYIRFFPGDQVLMLTSTDDMQGCVNSLKYREPRNTSVLIGHYKLHENTVTLVLKKPENKVNHSNIYWKRRRERLSDKGVRTFRVEFDIQNYHKRANWQLSWIGFNVCTQYPNGHETPICLNVCGRYPPLKFSRVKSYTQDSESPLQ
ncbi:hypothetical protein PV328_006603 [Microctonus aethiopoides]|uniref:F-box only protein 9 n=2 Tax=Microctonus aethiopoides TaxID=144406 RepID=A0AA39KTR8_9HYME|nr:hypothetical protein PV328_006603 [Microctonus aethiopoides]